MGWGSGGRGFESRRSPAARGIPGQIPPHLMPYAPFATHKRTSVASRARTCRSSCGPVSRTRSSSCWPKTRCRPEATSSVLSTVERIADRSPPANTAFCARRPGRSGRPFRNTSHRRSWFSVPDLPCRSPMMRPVTTQELVPPSEDLPLEPERRAIDGNPSARRAIAPVHAIKPVPAGPRHPHLDRSQTDPEPARGRPPRRSATNRRHHPWRRSSTEAFYP
jgi:hypothetical protein